MYAPPDEPDEDSDAIRHFNETVLNDPRVEVVTIPVRDGMSIVRRRNLASADAVATGVGGANILQRFRLNSKVALITGALNTGFCHLSSPSPPPLSSPQVLYPCKPAFSHVQPGISSWWLHIGTLLSLLAPLIQMPGGFMWSCA